MQLFWLCSTSKQRHHDGVCTTHGAIPVHWRIWRNAASALRHAHPSSPSWIWRRSTSTNELQLHASRQLTFHANMNMNSIPSTPLVVSSTWQQAPVVAPSIPETQFFEPTSYIAQTPISEAPPRLKTEEPTPVSAADSPSDSIGEETPTLSPSSYFWNQMVLPGCNDATGTCQCGDGCECVGCLTHGGHNGVQLDAPAISDDVAFPDFTADAAGLHLDDAAHFLFNPAPT
jgi:hypothetical protein